MELLEDQAKQGRFTEFRGSMCLQNTALWVSLDGSAASNFGPSCDAHCEPTVDRHGFPSYIIVLYKH